jgi:hypothetical protein
MIRNRFLLKAFTVFLLLEVMFNTLAPAVAWALTAGPTAPEASSFEPVDTTDMVNLATGELVYNMPLLEVPGPAGGYPLSLSYHAGIKPDQEASWVGLGFTLNPGAINRTVNGFADDNYNVRKEVKDYWDGGETLTKTYSLGVNIPNTGFGITHTVATTQDTYKGFSAKTYTSGSYTYGGLRTTVDSKGKVGFSVDPVAIGLSYINSPSLSAAYSTIGGFLGENSLGVTIGSNGVKTNLTLAGFTFNQKNNNAGSLSSYRNTIDHGMIPLLGYGTLHLKDFYTRYWSDQGDALYTYGPLYFGKNNANEDHYHYYDGTPDEGDPDYGESEFWSFASDVYNIPDTPFDIPMIWDPWDQADPARQVGGTLPSYDQYIVSAQGLSGAIEPNIFENGALRGQNSYFRHPTKGTPVPAASIIEHNSLRSFTSDRKVDYRFRNDFSNSLTMDAGNFTGNASTLSLSANTVSANADGYDGSAGRQKLAGSKHIEWFSNKEIHDGSATNKGFIDTYSVRTERSLTMEVYDNYLQPESCVPVFKENFNGRGSGIIIQDGYPENIEESYNMLQRHTTLKPRVVSLREKIGGFMITNESGVTYHYALPVYNYNEYTRHKVKKPLKGATTITETKNEEPYAYTWLLTAITGPDFVDRGGASGAPNGILDDEDFGYWVKFDYGKWTDSYQWRTPHTGYSSDLESEYETFSYGIKELYYLDAIETKSHKAFFVKSKRKDARGVTSRLEGGSNPRQYTMRFFFTEENSENPTGTAGFRERGKLVYSVSPVSTLKLDAIYLFDKKDIKDIPVTKAGGDKYDNAPISSPYTYYYTGENYVFTHRFPANNPSQVKIRNQEDFVRVKYHNGDLVFDDEDLKQLETHGFKQKALRTIVLNTDYSLSKNVPNSFEFFSGQGRSCGQLSNYSCAQQGEDFDFEWPVAVETQCRNHGVSSVPYCCDYSNNGVPVEQLSYSNDRSAFYSKTPLQSMRVQSDLCVSDFMGNDQTYNNDLDITYGKSGKLTLKSVKFLGKGGADLIPATSFSYLKNPDYSNKKYDEWGYYKSDYKDVEELVTAGTVDNDNSYFTPAQLFVGSRKITKGSAGNIDSWSLSSITSPLGGSINIEYEPNTFSKSVYNNYLLLSIDKLEREGTAAVKVYFKEKGLNLDEYFAVNESVDIKAFIVSGPYSSTSKLSRSDVYDDASSTVNTIAEKYITVNSPGLNQLLSNGRIAEIGGSTQAVSPYFVAGCVYIPQDEVTDKYAGGLRVKSLSMNDSKGHQYSTHYSYTKPGTSISSGVTSFQPFNAVAINFPTENEYFNRIMAEVSWNEDKRKLLDWRTQFLHRMNNMYYDILLFTREAPAPGALYEYVTIREAFDGRDKPQYTRHRFRVFNRDMVTVEREGFSTGDDTRGITLRNNAIDVGNLMKTEMYSSSHELLHSTTYGYMYDENNEAFETSLQGLKQGVLEQAFHKDITLHEYKFNGWDETPHYESIHAERKTILTKRVDRSNILTSVRDVNYKTGESSKTEYRAFDFYTGRPTQVLSQDAMGNSFMVVTTPAYRLEAYSGMTVTQINAQMAGMGLKLKNPNNKHMLAQEASSYTYKIDAGYNYVGLLKSSIQTWSDDINYLNPQTLSQGEQQSGIWRKHASFAFIGDENTTLRNDGLYPAANVTAFTAWNKGDAVPAGWMKLSEITLYDAESHGLEAVDLNGDYAASRMSSDHRQVVAAIANGRYNEFAYSGAEDFASNGYSANVVQKGSASESTIYRHTGYKSLAIPANGTGFGSSVRVQAKNYDRKMHVSFWLHKPTAQAVDLSYMYVSSLGTSTEPQFIPIDISKAKRAGDWVLCEVDIPIDRNTIATRNNLVTEIVNAGTSTIYIDDYRVHPVDAPVVSYVYYSTGELSHILDNNNLYTEYRYDDAGRLTSTYRESFQTEYGTMGIVKTGQTTYNYGIFNPFSISIQASKVGTSGSVSPLGQLTLLQGGVQAFYIAETCSAPKLVRVLVDGKSLDITQTQHTLWDGTQVTYSGGKLEFRNIQSAHSLQIEFFTSPGGGGGVSCHYDEDGCASGDYDYYIIDNCGDRVDREDIPYELIPVEIRPATQPTCQNLPGSECGIRD